MPKDHDATRWSVEDLIRHYLSYLEEQGKELRTRRPYESVAKNWVLPEIGTKPARRLSPDDVDRCFVRMREAGQSTIPSTPSGGPSAPETPRLLVHHVHVMVGLGEPDTKFLVDTAGPRRPEPWQRR